MTSATTDRSKATATQLNLSISGMSYASCVGRVERTLVTVPGVISASVSLLSGQARIAAIDYPCICSSCRCSALSPR